VTSNAGDLAPPVADPLRVRPHVGSVVDRAVVGQVGHHRPAPGRLSLPVPTRPHTQLAEECPARCLCPAGMGENVASSCHSKHKILEGTIDRTHQQ